MSSFYTRYLLFKYEWLVRELLAVNPQLSASMVSKNYMHKNFITNSKLNNSVYFWTIPLFRQNRVVLQIKTDLKFTDQIRYFDELEKKIKIKFTGITELDLSFQLTMI